MALMHTVVREAISLAQAAGWKVNVIPGNKGIVTIYPPGKYPPLNIAIDPDNEALRKWKGTATQFGLSGDGPAMTPEQRDAAAEALAKAKAEAKQDAAQERDAARQKAAEIAAVEAKQQAAIAAGRQAPAGLLFKSPEQGSQEVATVKQTVPAQAPAAKAAAPKPVAKKAAAKPALDEQGYPPFTPSLLTADSQTLKLTAGPDKGRFFCPACWETGERFTAKLQQGLASHRGFKHGAYVSTPGGSAVTQAVIPQDVMAALGLLTDSLAEAFASGLDSKDLDEAKAKLAQAEEMVRDLTGKLTDEQAKHRETLTQASEWKAKAEQRDQVLNRLQSEHEKTNGSAEREKKVLTEQFEKLLRDLRIIGQTHAPVQAVGKIDETIGKFLGE